ncbi:MAG: metal-dependent hydrolase [Candidatus Babeliales bacterium]
MPGYRTHLVGGLAAFSIITAICHTTFLPIQNNVLVFIAGFCLALLGSIFPDIDTVSVMQRLFYSTMAVALLALLISCHTQLFVLAGTLCIAIALLRHRTITHHALFLILMPFAIMLYCSTFDNSNQQAMFIFYLFFVGGALSHLLLDFYLPKRFH